MPSSPDSSSDSSTGSPGNHGNHYSDGPNPEVESCLPGVVSRCSCARHYAGTFENKEVYRTLFLEDLTV
jgi:hypothetical protein